MITLSTIIGAVGLLSGGKNLETDGVKVYAR